MNDIKDIQDINPAIQEANNIAKCIKAELEQILIGQSIPGDATLHISKIFMPTDLGLGNRSNLGKWTCWKIEAEDGDGKPYKKEIPDIANLLPYEKLYEIFRNKFMNTEFAFDKPSVHLPQQNSLFVASGAEPIILTFDAKPIVICPVKDAKSPAWRMLHLSIQSKGLVVLLEPHYSTKENPDAIRIGFKMKGSVISIRIKGRREALPIAKIMAVETTNRVITMQLDQNVKLFDPTNIIIE